MSETGPRSADTESPEAIVNALYDGISGPRGERDWARIRNLFLEGARLIPTGRRPNGDEGLRILDVEGWIASARPLFLEGPFYEVEVAQRSERFGKIAHAWSTYEYRQSADGPAVMAGINSIQLLLRDGRWWIVNVFWDNASEANPIPRSYLSGA